MEKFKQGIIYKRYQNNLQIALKAIFQNKLRSFLTMLGIIFGVAAVISMLSIGKGARKEILEQLKLVGVNNIMIKPLAENNTNFKKNEGQKGDPNNTKRYSPGLTLEDVNSIRNILPNIKGISPEISSDVNIIFKRKEVFASLKGVSPEFFSMYNLNLNEGALFKPIHEENRTQVCVIGSNIKNKLFRNHSPVNKHIKVNGNWIKVVGVLQQTSENKDKKKHEIINIFDDVIYVPTNTFLMRYNNKGNFSAHMMQPKLDNKKVDKIVVKVAETDQLLPSVEILNRILLRRHNQMNDFEIIIPELLIKQQVKTNNIFNIVLGIIASISLIVGGIGIMNIMFTSVMERIKEIGLRLSVGAEKKDIKLQFLAESVMICIGGGILGVILGIVSTYIISKMAGIATIITLDSIIISFCVSAMVGVLFGYYPAKSASDKNPIESLRYE